MRLIQINKNDYMDYFINLDEVAFGWVEDENHDGANDCIHLVFKNGDDRWFRAEQVNEYVKLQVALFDMVEEIEDWEEF